MKQTAVDFLSDKYMYVTWLRNRDEISAEEGDKMRAKYLAESKEMEKEQIEQAYRKGVFCYYYKGYTQKYYEDTFGKK